MNTIIRKSARTPIRAEVQMRRAGSIAYRVRVHDLSRFGCKIEFVERPKLDELLWVKFDGLEALPGLVCWVEAHAAGVEFERAIYQPVFDMLLARLQEP